MQHHSSVTKHACFSFPSLKSPFSFPPIFPVMVALDKTLHIAFHLRSRCLHHCVRSAARYSTSVSGIVENSITGTNDAIIQSKHQKRLDLFSSYKAKVIAARVPRVEKVEVNFLASGIGHGATLLMNKGLSTPYNCAQHISKTHVRNSVIALVKKAADTTQELTVLDNNIIPAAQESDGKVLDVRQEDSTWIPWDMHRPLEYDCDLKFLKFNMDLATPEEMAVVNNAYWNTCALMLGAVVKQAFKEDAMVRLVRVPKIDIKSGAFCYDVELLDDAIESNSNTKWHEDEQTLVQLTKVARHIITQNDIFERLDLPKEDAIAIFADDNRICERLHRNYQSVNNNPCVPVYKFGSYLDIADGPLLPSTAFMFHYVVTAVHRLGSTDNGSYLWRFQGLSLPKSLQVHHAIWAMLERRAKRLIKKDLPVDMLDHEELEVPLHKYRSIENKTKRYNLATGQWLEDSWLKSKDMNS